MKKILFKVCEFVFFFTAFTFMFSLNAKAYIDPSVVTYTIQVGAGIVIAVGAVIGIYFRKAKKKINNKLGIDENKNKEVESDDILETKEDTKKEKSAKKAAKAAAEKVSLKKEFEKKTEKVKKDTNKKNVKKVVEKKKTNTKKENVKK